MTDQLTATITIVLTRAPEWIRHDFLAKDESTRTRAEETLAAMIGTAITESAK